MRRLIPIVLAITVFPISGPVHGDVPVDRWVELTPPARAEHYAFLDARRHRLVVFGGEVLDTPRNDVWALSLVGRPRWTRVEAIGEAPPPRAGAAAAYDPVRDRLIVFGGQGSHETLLDDVWELSLRGRARWSRVETTGPRPRERSRGTLTFDPGSGRFVLFGGAQGYSRRYDDLWVLDVQSRTWERLQPGGARPDGRSGHGAVHSPELDAFLVAGGEVMRPIPGCLLCYEHRETGEVWRLSLCPQPAWTLLQPTSGETPCGMQGISALWDGQRQSLVIIGGVKHNQPWESCPPPSMAWALSVPDLRWSRIDPGPTAPRARAYGAAVIDPSRRTIWVYGGEGAGTYSDAWRLSLEPDGVWEPLLPEQVGPSFSVLDRGAAAFDEARETILMDKGSEIWSFDLRTEAWSRVAGEGDGPPAHRGNMAMFDSRRDRFVIYGGRLDPQHAPWYFQEVWALTRDDVPRWEVIATTGELPAPLYESGIYDPVRDRLIVYASGFGDGSSAAMRAASGVWALPLGVDGPAEWQHIWSPLDPGQTVGPTTQAATAVYDSKRDRLVIFGGGYSTFDGWHSVNGCWALPLSGEAVWEELSPSSPPGAPSPFPAPRLWACGVYDAARDRIVITGGLRSGFVFHLGDDAVAFSLESREWERLDTPENPHPRWIAPIGAHDGRRGRTVFLEGDAVWVLEGGKVLPRRRATPLADGVGPAETARPVGLAGATPNPFTGELWVDFTLPDDTTATLELLDVAGRRIWLESVGGRGAGTHRIQIPTGDRLKPGVYLLRLGRGSVFETRKVIRLGH